MERGERLVWIAGVASVPGAVLLGMLIFQLKSVEVLNRNAEAELQLGNLKRQRQEREMEAASEAAAAPAAAPAAQAEPS